ncbi:MAG: hypothetical protein M3R36_00270 [Bacteroidota bacterium]|nr:hypothetical protein [Bacteroidota bacterium]
MNSTLKNIISEIKTENNTLFIEYLDDYLSSRNYIPESNQNALKNKYQDILDFFRKKLESENKTNKD